MAAETTDILSLPFIMPSQAQKHVTHNEALETLDAVVQLSVSGTAASPPLSPAAGERWIVAPAPDGAFAGHQGEIAVLRDGVWAFVQPLPGWTAYDRVSGRILAHDGAAWAEVEPPAALAGLESVGINATADAENRLALASPSSLFTHEGAGHRLKVNKAGEGETASLLFQSAYEGRAEMGLAGSDDFAVKVSADGTAWHEAIRVESATGRVGFPSGGAREMLFAPRTYHVAPAGSDANSGLSADEAFATLQKAVDSALAFDAAGNPVTIQLADGTHAGASMSRPMFDGRTLAIQGNTAAPANVVVDGGAPRRRRQRRLCGDHRHDRDRRRRAAAFLCQPERPYPDDREHDDAHRHAGLL
jgi:hypothetical protein